MAKKKSKIEKIMQILKRARKDIVKIINNKEQKDLFTGEVKK